MYSIKSDCLSTTEINKSKFICRLIKIENQKEILDMIKAIKKEYKDATHYCYAYICGNIKRFSDDGEPGGTAGMPILNVLETNELNYVLAVVIRYFGGVKLGAGGLVRAYTNSVVNALKKTERTELIPGKKIRITIDYANDKIINNLLSNCTILDKQYLEDISYTVLIPNKEIQQLENYQLSYKILEDDMYIS